MNPIAYLTNPDPLFGWIEWILLIAQIVLLLVGAYFSFLYRDASRVKVQALQRFGYVMLALGGLGALLGFLKLGVVSPFDTRLWLTLIVVFEVALGVYGLIYSRTTYPEQVAASRRTTRPSPAGRASSSSGRRQVNETITAPRPVEVPVPRVASGRREARRDRKRKKR